MPVVFVSHGGGPMPLLGDPGHGEMVAALQTMAADLPRPDCLLVVTAHWEADTVSVSSGAAPGMLYDYGGFPPEAYTLQYGAPGAPAMADRVRAVLGEAGITAAADPDRGFDHGTFVPLMLLYPDADIPVLQISLERSLDPARHLAIGKALSPLLSEGGMIIGSGQSFHNIPLMFQADNPDVQKINTAFHGWLDRVVLSPELAEPDRESEFESWAQAPFAGTCHPREEHLVPLMVCAGAARAAARRRIDYSVMGIEARGYIW
ncbi:dioxygenase [Sneathiella chinensis]|uniref:Dioxygenase n=2 Tax=Sneathiella chinensis TaxID=349750 RepID=A0ABQ5U8G6_9PROT|nr:dioxygenase [Sneathiella chinensis]